MLWLFWASKGLKKTYTTDSATEHTYYIPSPTDLAGLRNVVEDWIDPMPAQGASWLRANLRVKNPAETIKPNTLPHSSFMGFPLRLFACFDSGVSNLLGGVFVVFETHQTRSFRVGCGLGVCLGQRSHNEDPFQIFFEQPAERRWIDIHSFPRYIVFHQWYVG